MILFITATPWEQNAVLRRLPMLPVADGVWATSIPREPAVLVVAGMGPKAVREGLRRYRAVERGLKNLGRIEMAVSLGFAGALDPTLSSGELVCDVHGLELDRVAQLREALAGAGLKFSMGKVAHTEKVLAPAEKRLRSENPKDRHAIVDMESAEIRDWAERRNAPFLAMRAVVDEVDDRLPSGAPEGPGMLDGMSFLMSHLGEASILWRTWGKQRRAGSSLGRAVKAFMESF